MKNIVLLLITILCANVKSYSQDLYVSPSSYVFVQDEVLFVNNDIQLEESDSNIYLRDKAQLVQNNDVKNSDAGELSVYQEQTTGVYEYNFWCSPVGNSVDGITKSNVAFEITNLHKPNNPSDNSDINSPTYNLTNSYESTANQIAKYWLWKLEAAEGYSDWVQVSDISTVEPGLGFTMKGSPTPNNTLDFRGRPNTGSMTQSCAKAPSATDRVSTLTGNPYASAMDLWKFLKNITNQSSLDGSVYFWEQAVRDTHELTGYEGGYAVWKPLDLTDENDPGIYIPATYKTYDTSGNVSSSTGAESDDYTSSTNRRFAAVGQGFIVMSNPSNNGGNFEINNSMRLYLPQATSKATDGAQFGRRNISRNNNDIVAMSHNGLDYMDIIRNPTKIPEIRFQTKINDTYYRENVLSFKSNRNKSYNKEGDALIPSILSSDNYFIADDKKLVIKTIAYDINASIQFGFNAQNETNTYSIKIIKFKNIDDDIKVFVHDKELETYTDIINNSFDISLPKGDYDDRFEIVFKNSNETLNNDNIEDETIESFDVYQNNNIKEFVVKNPKSHTIKSFMMFDITGKVIYNKQNLGNGTLYTFPTNSLSSGTYVTKITTDKNIDISKKVIIKN